MKAIGTQLKDHSKGKTQDPSISLRRTQDEQQRKKRRAAKIGYRFPGKDNQQRHQTEREERQRASWPILGCVIDGENFSIVVLQAVNDDVGESGHDQFSRIFQHSGPA
jgi:hypothetical protein